MRTIAYFQSQWGANCFDDSQKFATFLGMSLEDAVAWFEGLDVKGGNLPRADKAFIDFAVANGVDKAEAELMIENHSAYEFICSKMKEK